MRSQKKEKRNIGSVALTMICLLFALPFINCSSVYAAASTLDVKVPYTHIYDADGNRTNDVFTYQIKAKDGAPAPQGSKDGVYYFDIKGVPGSGPVTGDLDLKIDFSGKGEYSYDVSAFVPDKEDGFSYEKRTYTLNVYVRPDGNGGLKVAMVTAVGDNGHKYGRLQFNPGHESEMLPPEEVRPTTTPTGDGTVPDGGVMTDGQGVVMVEEVSEAEGNSPLTELFSNAVPKAAPDRRFCSLIDILLTVLTVLICAALYVRYFGRVDNENDEYIIRRGGRLRLTSAIPAVISAVTLICVQDFSQKKLWQPDEWTLFLSVMLAAAMMVMVAAYVRYDRDVQELSY